MADLSVLHGLKENSRRLNEYIFGDGDGRYPTPDEEVPHHLVIGFGPISMWDYVDVKTSSADESQKTITIDTSRFYKSLMENIRFEWETQTGDLQFDYREQVWIPFEGAIAELKRVVAMWRSIGWNDAADILENKDEEGDIYNSLGKFQERIVPHRINLKLCTFYRTPFAAALEKVRDPLGVEDSVTLRQVVIHEDSLIDRALHELLPTPTHFQELVMKGAVEKLNTRGIDIRTMIAPCPDPNAPFAEDSEEDILDARLTRGDWHCPAHVPPFLNDVESVKCEVCGRPKPSA